MKLWPLAFASLLVLSSACTPPAESTGSISGTTGTKPTMKIAMIPKGTTHEFWKSVHAGADEAAKAQNIELIWKGPLKEDDREAQIQVVEDFTTQGVAGICVAPLDDVALRKPIEEAMDKKIPVLIFDSGLADPTGTVSLVATDNKHGGAMAGEAMAKDLGKGGKVILLRYQEGSASTVLREEGFLEAAKAAGLEVISSDQHAGATVESAQKVAENLINRFKNPDGTLGAAGIFCPNESSTFGMLRALQDAKISNVKFYGFDSSEKLVAALSAGQITGLIVQNPFNMGKLAVESMVKAIKGDKVEPIQDTGAVLATKENMETEDIKKVLNPPKI